MTPIIGADYCEVRRVTEQLAAPLSAEDQTVQSMPEFPVTNTATIAAGSGEVDVNTSNNSSSTTNAVGIFVDDFGSP